jgi:hypothetical protein
MKRVVLVVSFILLMFLYACGSTSNTPIPPVIGTAVAQTQTASMWTASITPTIVPDISEILALLNASFPGDELQTTLDVKYIAVNAWFQYLPDNVSTAFCLEIHCECTFNSHCCTPERMFVIAINAMKEHADEIIPQMPRNMARVDIVCYDCEGPTDTMQASWTDVRAYLLEEIKGSILGYRVTAVSTP